MKKIDVCLSPDLLHLHKLEDKVVVVIDILRATSCMVTALAHGVKTIMPVATLEECKILQSKGYIAAAERDGKQANGFDLGNSPFSFMNPAYKGKDIAMTTTNGTIAIQQAKAAEQIIIGAFLNIKVVASYLSTQPRDVILLCAGWKGKVNLEDTLFAGALIDGLEETFEPDCDAPRIARAIFNIAKDDLYQYLQDSSHVKRLHNLNIHKDIAFCLQSDKYDVIPYLKNNKLVKLEAEKSVLA